jgi:hypothetical protein
VVLDNPPSLAAAGCPSLAAARTVDNQDHTLVTSVGDRLALQSLLTGLQVVGQVEGWKVQHIVFVDGTCGLAFQ